MSTTANRYGFWGTWLGRLLLACVPTYGNYGGPGWTGGKRCHVPDDVDWDIEPVDDMDALFKEHDWQYQHGCSLIRADTVLVQSLHSITPVALYGRLYRVAAIRLFSLRVAWLLKTGQF